MISKELETEVEHGVQLGKRERFTNQPAEPLPQGIIQAFNVIGLALLFADQRMRSLWQSVIGTPQVAEAVATLISSRQLAPKA